jgi:hypothetical protein
VETKERVPKAEAAFARILGIGGNPNSGTADKPLNWRSISAGANAQDT